jgi:hypothetical protein
MPCGYCPLRAICANIWPATRSRGWSPSTRPCHARTPAKSSSAACASLIWRKLAARFSDSATTCGPYVAQRSTGKRSSMKPISGLRCAASSLHTVVVAASGLELMRRESGLTSHLCGKRWRGRQARVPNPRGRHICVAYAGLLRGGDTIQPWKSRTNIIDQLKGIHVERR